VSALRLELKKSMPGRRIAIVGSGFAGSILARVLQLQGHRVTLLDRGRHPRFALGESSTPLAALSLERLAKRYGQEDLHALAAYGRWRERLPDLRRGLKRGFTFYGHQPGEPYRNGPTNEHRLLVAASPNDAIADTHWLREDVDHHLARQAAIAGVECLEAAEVTGLARDGAGWRVSGIQEGMPFELATDLIFDASGPGGFLARHLDIPSALPKAGLATSLVYGHFADVPPFPETAGAASFPPGPYPDEQAAVHHLLAEGWMYVLPFDHGVVSAGVVLSQPAARERAARLLPEEAWAAILGRYPTLAAQFGGARALRPIATIPRLQHRLERAAGDGWALLPHAFRFTSPMFSTGIAWSLLAVERLALLLEKATGTTGSIQEGLDRYGALLHREADHLGLLVEGGYEAAARDFDLFVPWTDLYFAAASFGEIRQRLFDAPEGGGAWAWEGFLGSTDPVIREALGQTLADLRNGPEPGAFADRVRDRIAPRNLAGLADPTRNRLYPVSLEPLVRNCQLLGLNEEELHARLPRLRGHF
jgi:FADH2 O2-dependent halogenase